MDPQHDLRQLEQDAASWWHIARRNLLREVVAQALRGKREARILDMGGKAELAFEQPALWVVNQHNSLDSAAFAQLHGRRHLVCSSIDELAFASNCFDVVLAGDFLQLIADDRSALRELLRVLKDGGLLCLTVPAYSFLWGDDDERRGHCRRYRASELRGKLTTAGFEVQRASYFVATAFLPLAMARMTRNILHTAAVRDNHYPRHSRVASAAMVTLLDAERQLMHHINLPFGTRLVCWARKPAMVAITVPAWERQWVASPRLTWSGSES